MTKRLIHDESQESIGGKFDVPELYDFFYEERDPNLFGDFSLEEFIYYLKIHT